MTICLPHVHLEAPSPELRVTSEVTHSRGTPKVKGEEDRASICSQAWPSPSPWLLEHPTLAAQKSGQAGVMGSVPRRPGWLGAGPGAGPGAGQTDQR